MKFDYYEEKLQYFTKEQEKTELQKEISRFAHEVYEEYSRKNSWSLIAKNLAAFLNNGVLPGRVYEDFKNNSKWHSIGGNFRLLLADGIGVKAVYDDCRSFGQWRIIAQNLSVLRENGVAVDMTELYRGLQKDGDRETIENNAAEFLANGVEPALLYEDFRQAGSLDCIAANLDCFFENGLNCQSVYADFAAENNWRLIAECASDFLRHGIAADKIYEDCRCQSPAILALALPALPGGGLDAAFAYDDLRQRGLWQVVAAALPVLAPLVDVDFRAVYQGLVNCGAFKILTANAENLIGGGIAASEIYNTLAKAEKWQYIADNPAVFADNAENIGLLYEKLKANSLWQEINKNIPVFLQSEIAAEQIYNDLKGEKKWWCITDNLAAFAAAGIGAAKVYADLKETGRWGEIVNSADAFVEQNITIKDMEVYEYLRQEGSWGGWNKVSMFLASTIKDKENLAEVLHKFNANGWWDEIAFSLSVFADNDINVDVDMIYRHLKERGWWKTIIQDLDVFLKYPCYVGDIYDGLLQKGSWGRDQIVENLDRFLAGGLNPALYILDAEPLQLLRSIGVLLEFCESAEMLAALKMRGEEVAEDENFMMAIKKGFTLSEILRYPFICSPLLAECKGC